MSFLIFTCYEINAFDEAVTFCWNKAIITSIFKNFVFKIITISILTSIDSINLKRFDFINITIEYNIFCVLTFIDIIIITFIITDISKSNKSRSSLITIFQITKPFKFTSIIYQYFLFNLRYIFMNNMNLICFF